MKVTQTIAASAIFMLICSALSAQEAKTGMVKQIDRLNGTIAIEQPQSGTTGGSGSTVKQYKVQGASLDELHAGDRVSFSTNQSSGSDIITKIEKKR